MTTPPTYDAQVLFVRTSRCLRCGSIHTLSELFACDSHDRNGRHLFPATALNENMPLEKVALKVRLTPICHACTDTLQPVTDRESYARWQDTIRRKKEQDRAAAKATAPKKPEPTLRDLI